MISIHRPSTQTRHGELIPPAVSDTHLSAGADSPEMRGLRGARVLGCDTGRNRASTSARSALSESLAQSAGMLVLRRKQDCKHDVASAVRPTSRPGARGTVAVGRRRQDDAGTRRGLTVRSSMPVRRVAPRSCEPLEAATDSSQPSTITGGDFSICSSRCPLEDDPGCRGQSGRLVAVMGSPAPHW
jgi:hypothetical protein